MSAQQPSTRLAMADIRVGMVVLDSSGEDLGDVSRVAPDGDTSDSNELTKVLSEAAEARLAGGYIKVSREMYPFDLFVAADQIASVGDFGVRLNVEGDELVAF